MPHVKLREKSKATTKPWSSRLLTLAQFCALLKDCVILQSIRNTSIAPTCEAVRTAARTQI